MNTARMVGLVLLMSSTMAAQAAETREARLAGLRETFPRMVFTKHANLGGSHYAYTECQSDAQAERHWLPGSALCVLDLTGGEPRVITLLDDPKGMIRDPDVSFDGKRILFAWKKSDREDDFHLYEMDAESRKIRQLTFGKGVADYEGAYLPDGSIIFNSTRCVQTVDCWWTEVSNLYKCDADGGNIRRLCFDQVHDNYPAVLADGRIVYTRWEYNDRGQIYTQPLYQMNADGTGQTEFYGNNSWFPTTIMHARGIGKTGKVVAILSGHHSRQAGKLAVIDPARGNQENAGVQLVAPVRATPAERVDAYGQQGELFSYPIAINEEEFVVSYAPEGWKSGARFSLYWFNAAGERELLAEDAKTSCSQPVPLAARDRPVVRPSAVDERKSSGVFYLADIYSGPGLKGVPRGTIKKLRVIALDFRAAGIGQNGSRGPAGGALASTPISIGNGAWDVKIILGDAKVHEDGSAYFNVPARTPVYFQALDEKNRAVQTMRSWSTVQPGETASCVGCHESKQSVPAVKEPSIALRAGAQKLEAFYGSPRGFSFAKEVQPALDRHCVSCHHGDLKKEKGAFSLLARPMHDAQAKRYWSEGYLALTGGVRKRRSDSAAGDEMVNWMSAQSVPSMLEPYHAGSTRSRLPHMLDEGHYGVKLSREEMDKLVAWIDLCVPFCGDYTEANAWSEGERRLYQRYLEKRQRHAR